MKRRKHDSSSVMLFSGQEMTLAEAQDVTKLLLDGSLRTLTLRNCTLQSDIARRLFSALEENRSLRQLNLSCGTLNDSRTVRLLSRALRANQTILSLSVHGNILGGAGLGSLGFSLLEHANITVLDLGDCKLADDSMPLICDLLLSHTPKPGLHELCLSGNPDVTQYGWNCLCIAMAASSCLRSLQLDFNRLGDSIAASLAVALAANSSLLLLDLESCGIRDRGAEALHFLLSNYPVRLQLLNLCRNQIRRNLLNSLSNLLGKSVISDDPNLYMSIDVTNTSDVSTDDENYTNLESAAPTLSLISSKRSKMRYIQHKLEEAKLATMETPLDSANSDAADANDANDDTESVSTTDEETNKIEKIL